MQGGFFMPANYPAFGPGSEAPVPGAGKAFTLTEDTDWDDITLGDETRRSIGQVNNCNRQKHQQYD